VLETAAYAITTVYANRHQYPFSTYGENLFLSIQNVFITLLIIYYSGSRLVSGKESKATQIVVTTALIGTSLYFLYTVPSAALQGLQMSTVPLSVLSKLPQISQNYRARSTGQLSAFAVLSQIAGCLARIFTTATEVRDSIVLSGFIVALGLNLVLGAQMWLYWGQRVEEEMFMEKEVPSGLPQQTNEILSSGSIPPRYQSPTPSRRWARKVD
jgi:mannose-P-dolichol utilization defect protein 1